MASISKKLYENCQDSALPYTATTRTVDPDKHEHLQRVFVSFRFTVLRQKYTLTEGDKRVPRPVSKESLWHELVWLLPILCYDAS